MADAVKFDRVSLRLGDHPILTNCTFAIREGEFVGVLGPNGAGKTTLMRAVLGLLSPSGGQVRVLGHVPRRGDAAIGYLPQVRTVLPDLNVRGLDFIASSLNGAKWGLPSLKRADRQLIEKTLTLVGARDLSLRPLSQMSGGERQRLLLAQALMGQPKLLLLDEPLISLDARYQEVAIAVVRKLCRERGITVLFSAHELNQLLGSIDRVLYLGNRQAVLGTVDEVVTAPVLSRLYDTDIKVLRMDGQIFVTSHGRDIERVAHQHDHDHEHHVH
jgi:zinc/manganese transport system ATP-binding protein